MSMQKLNQPRQKKISVIIIEDHPLFRQGLEKTLGMATDIVLAGFANTGQAGIERAKLLQPDVILLDVNLPDQNGHQVAHTLSSDCPDIGIVMLTAYHDVHQELFAIRGGASAYCSKDIEPDTLIQVIRDVAKGYYVVDGKRLADAELEQWIQRKVDEVIGSSHTEHSDQHFIPLSPRETEILRSVTSGMSNKEIALELGISQQTVKNHMTAVLRKLNVEDRTQAAVTALRYGWVRLQDPSLGEK